MMTRFVLPLCAVLSVAASCAFAQETAPNGQQLYTATREQLDVSKVVLAQERAWNAGDLKAYLALFKDAKDTEAMMPTGPVRGLENIRSAFGAAYPTREKMGTLEQSEVEVRALGEDHALASGRYHLSRSRKNGGDTDGGFWEILEKTGGRWVVIFSMTG